ncbi:WD40 repeat domain-containing protein [Candidatus Poribacteria bacterium]|nr:WD40 repeat domain-containing protein [Candidatus Poribacteria bacterium]
MIKNKMLLIPAILFAIFILAQNTFAQDSTLWQLPEGAKRRLGKGTINEVRYTADGMHIAVASSIGIWLYAAHTGKVLDLLTGHTGGVSSIDFSPDGKILASGSSDGTIRLWDVETRQHIRTFIGFRYPVHVVVFSPDGNKLASGHRHSTIRLWDVETGELSPNFTSGRTSQLLSIAYSWIADLAFSPDGKILASVGSDSRITLWDVENGQRINDLFGHQGWTLDEVVFSPDGKTIVSVGFGKLFHLWNF